METLLEMSTRKEYYLQYPYFNAWQKTIFELVKHFWFHASNAHHSRIIESILVWNGFVLENYQAIIWNNKARSPVSLP